MHSVLGSFTILIEGRLKLDVTCVRLNKELLSAGWKVLKGREKVGSLHRAAPSRWVSCTKSVRQKCSNVVQALQTPAEG